MTDYLTIRGYKYTPEQELAYKRAEQLLRETQGKRVPDDVLEELRVEYHRCLKKLWEVSK